MGETKKEMKERIKEELSLQGLTDDEIEELNDGIDEMVEDQFTQQLKELGFEITEN